MTWPSAISCEVFSPPQMFSSYTGLLLGLKPHEVHSYFRIFTQAEGCVPLSRSSPALHTTICNNQICPLCLKLLLSRKKFQDPTVTADLRIWGFQKSVSLGACWGKEASGTLGSLVYRWPCRSGKTSTIRRETWTLVPKFEDRETVRRDCHLGKGAPDL